MVNLATGIPNVQDIAIATQQKKFAEQTYIPAQQAEQAAYEAQLKSTQDKYNAFLATQMSGIQNRNSITAPLNPTQPVQNTQLQRQISTAIGAGNGFQPITPQNMAQAQTPASNRPPITNSDGSINNSALLAYKGGIKTPSAPGTPNVMPKHNANAPVLSPYEVYRYNRNESMASPVKENPIQFAVDYANDYITNVFTPGGMGKIIESHPSTEVKNPNQISEEQGLQRSNFIKTFGATAVQAASEVFGAVAIPFNLLGAGIDSDIVWGGAPPTAKINPNGTESIGQTIMSPNQWKELLTKEGWQKQTWSITPGGVASFAAGLLTFGGVVEGIDQMVAEATLRSTLTDAFVRSGGTYIPEMAASMQEFERHFAADYAKTLLQETITAQQAAKAAGKKFTANDLKAVSAKVSDGMASQIHESAEIAKSIVKEQTKSLAADSARYFDEVGAKYGIKNVEYVLNPNLHWMDSKPLIPNNVAKFGLPDNVKIVIGTNGINETFGKQYFNDVVTFIKTHEVQHLSGVDFFANYSNAMDARLGELVTWSRTITEAKSAGVNPAIIEHFVNTYKPSGNMGLTIMEELKRVGLADETGKILTLEKFPIKSVRKTLDESGIVVDTTPDKGYRYVDSGEGGRTLARRQVKIPENPAAVTDEVMYKTPKKVGDGYVFSKNQLDGMPETVSITNPAVLNPQNFDKLTPEAISELRKQGFDGAVVPGEDGKAIKFAADAPAKVYPIGKTAKVTSLPQELQEVRDTFSAPDEPTSIPDLMNVAPTGEEVNLASTTIDETMEGITPDMLKAGKAKVSASPAPEVKTAPKVEVPKAKVTVEPILDTPIEGKVTKSAKDPNIVLRTSKYQEQLLSEQVNPKKLSPDQFKANFNKLKEMYYQYTQVVTGQQSQFAHVSIKDMPKEATIQDLLKKRGATPQSIVNYETFIRVQNQLFNYGLTADEITGLGLHAEKNNLRVLYDNEEIAAIQRRQGVGEKYNTFFPMEKGDLSKLIQPGSVAKKAKPLVAEGAINPATGARAESLSDTVAPITKWTTVKTADIEATMKKWATDSRKSGAEKQPGDIYKAVAITNSEADARQIANVFDLKKTGIITDGKTTWVVMTHADELDAEAKAALKDLGAKTKDFTIHLKNKEFSTKVTGITEEQKLKLDKALSKLPSKMRLSIKEINFGKTLEENVGGVYHARSHIIDLLSFKDIEKGDYSSLYHEIAHNYFHEQMSYGNMPNMNLPLISEYIDSMIKGGHFKDIEDGLKIIKNNIENAHDIGGTEAVKLRIEESLARNFERYQANNWKFFKEDNPPAKIFMENHFSGKQVEYAEARAKAIEDPSPEATATAARAKASASTSKSRVKGASTPDPVASTRAKVASAPVNNTALFADDISKLNLHEKFVTDWIDRNYKARTLIGDKFIQANDIINGSMGISKRTMEHLRSAVMVHLGKDISYQTLDTYAMDLHNIEILTHFPDRKTPGMKSIADYTGEIGQIKTDLGAEAFSRLEKAHGVNMDYFKQRLQEQVAAGNVSQKNFDIFTKKYPNYIPYVDADNIDSYLKTPRGKIGVSGAVVKKLGVEGSTLDQLPMSKLLPYLDMKYQLEIARNKAALVINDSFSKNIEWLKKKATLSKDEMYTMTFRKDGVATSVDLPKYMEKIVAGVDVTSLTNGFGAADDFLRITQKVAKAGSTTLNPVWWALTNPTRDYIGAWLGYRVTPVDIAAGAVEYVKDMFNHNDKFINEITRRGNGVDTAGIISRPLEKLYGKTPKQIVKIIGDSRSLYDTAGMFSHSGADSFKQLYNLATIPADISENATRLAIAKKVFKNTGDYDIAAHAYRAGTIDYGQMGARVGSLNTVYMFLNPGIQGSLLPMRHMLRDPGGFAIGAGILSAAVAGVYAWNSQFPEYQDVTFRHRYGGIIFMLPSNTYNAAGNKVPRYINIVPAASEWSPFVGCVTYALEQFNHTSPDKFNDFIATIAGQANPINQYVSTDASGLNMNWQSFVPFQAFKVPLEIITNFDPYSGSAIVPSSLKGVPAREQYTAYTPRTAIVIGQRLGISPIKVQFFINGMLGTFGRLAMDAGDTILNKVINNDRTAKLSSLALQYNSYNGGEDPKDNALAKHDFLNTLSTQDQTDLLNYINNRDKGVPIVTDIIKAIVATSGGQRVATATAEAQKAVGNALPQVVQQPDQLLSAKVDSYFSNVQTGELTIKDYISQISSLRTYYSGWKAAAWSDAQGMSAITQTDINKHLDPSLQVPDEESALQAYNSFKSQVWDMAYSSSSPTAFTDAQRKLDNYLAGLSTSQRNYIQKHANDWVKALSAPAQALEVEIENEQNAVQPYYDNPNSADKLAYRKSNPKVDAYLFFLGRTTTIESQGALDILKTLYAKYGIQANLPVVTGAGTKAVVYPKYSGLLAPIQH